MENAQKKELNGPSAFQARLEESRAGGGDHLGLLLEVYRPYLLKVANDELDSDLRPKAGGSDLVQQTFLEANKNFEAFRGATEAELIAWLRKILLNNIANLHRQYRSTGKRDIDREVSIHATGSSVINVGIPPAKDDSPSQEALAREEAEAIERALARLPADYRTAIVMRHQLHRSFAEIGAALNRSPEAARKVWARAIEALQVELD